MNILSISKCHLISLDSNTIELIQQYDQLKKKFGDTALFKEFKEKYGHEIDFLKFQKENKLKYNEKKGWNKQFKPITKTVWITDKRNYNKELKKFGYYQTIQTGWTLVQNDSDGRCWWCNKRLYSSKNPKFCSTKDGRCRKLYHKVMKKGKELYGFDPEIIGHILIKPNVWESGFDKNGQLWENQVKDRIEFKDIWFSIKGKKHQLTTKSRTIKD